MTKHRQILEVGVVTRRSMFQSAVETDINVTSWRRARCRHNLMLYSTNTIRLMTDWLTVRVRCARAFMFHSLNRPPDFLLLARYVPNVAKRSTWEQCIYWGPTTYQPTNDRPRILENFERPYLYNGSSDPLHVWFYVGFSRSADRMALLPVGPNPRSRPSAVLCNFEWPYLWKQNGSSNPIRI